MIDISEFAWEEKYRPKSVEECILPESTKNLFKTYVDNSNIPNLLLAGQHGSGKTTSALAMCKEIGCDYLFINGSSENGIDIFRNKITNYASSMSLSGGKKVIIIDEADRLSPNAFDALKAGTEAFHMNCTFIMTSNHRNRIPAPILSRFTEVEFTISKNEKLPLITKFFKRICTILEKENIEYDKEVLAVLINKFFPDYRKTLVELQKYSINGKIDSGILSQVGDIQLRDLIKYLKDKDYTKTRAWVVSNIDTDPNTIYRKIYDALYDFVKPSSIPNIILIMARYQYQTSFVIDPEIQLLSFLTEVMLEGEFL
jgi:DNA polymerase III delta prime subunit